MAAISNFAHLLVTYIVYGLSLLSNSFLIHCVNTVPDKEQIGSYRYLLATFAISNLLFSSAHALLVPRVYGTHFGYILYSQNFLTCYEAWGTVGGIIFFVSLFLPFLILCFQHIYRALAVNGMEGGKLVLFMSAVFINLASSIECSIAVKIGLLPSELKRKLYSPYLLNETSINIGATPKPGFIAIVFRVANENGTLEWESDAIESISHTLGIFLVTVIVIGVCIVRMVRGWRWMANRASENVKTMHAQLLVALITQTAIQWIFTFIPFAVISLFPVIGYALGGQAADLLILATAIAPAVAPILIISLVGRYRTHALVSLARLLSIEGRFNEWRKGRSTVKKR